MEREKEELRRSCCCCMGGAGESDGEEEVKEVNGPVDVDERCSSCGVDWFCDVGEEVWLEAEEPRRINGELGKGKREEEEEVLACG